MKANILKFIFTIFLSVFLVPFAVFAQTGGTMLVNSSGTSPFIGSFTGVSLDGALTGVVYNKLATGTKTTVEIYTGTAYGAQGTFLGATTTNFPSVNWNAAYGATGTNIFKFFVPANLYDALKKYFVFAVTNGKKYQLNNSPKDLTVVRPVMCVVEGVSYAGGSLKRFYSKSQVNTGEKCADVMVTKRCENGTFVGTAGYDFTSCTVKQEEYEKSAVLTPINDAVDVASSTTLTWTNSTHNTFAVYLGIDTIPDSSEFKGYVTGKSFTPSNLLANQKYYWRIDSVNAAHTATTTGVVWSFRTKASDATGVPSPPLANIESGQVLSGTVIILTAGTTEEVYYTLNLQEPVCGQSTRYTSSITINADTTVKAVTCANGQKSEVLTLEYKIARLPDSVRATPPPQRFSTDLEIGFDTTENASIFYTTNGDNPRCDIDEMYLPDFKPYIYQTTTFKAIACNSLGHSQISSFTYEYFLEPTPAPIDIVPDPGGFVVPDTSTVDPGLTPDNSALVPGVDASVDTGTNLNSLNPEGEVATDTQYTKIVVNQTKDVGEGTLRAAIEQVNSLQNGELGKIVFDLPKNNTRICPKTPLPAITSSAYIDGGSQADFVGKPIVLLDGSCMTVPGTGLILKGEKSIVKSLVINNFKGDGIYIEGGGGHQIMGNYIGTNYFGQSIRSNRLNGIQINRSNNNIIGGEGKFEGNLISGNRKNGVYIRGGSSKNKIINNTIGLNVIKTLLLPNSLNGVSILDSSANMVGGEDEAAKNTIAGNIFNGIYVSGRNAAGNNILGNDIDNNKNGISLVSTGKNMVGSDIETSGNVIKKNTGYGVLISRPTADISIVSDTNLIQENSLKNIKVIR